jgi:small subunit ribosomal protein S3
VGQKVHPYGFRLGVTKTWRSRWFAKADYAKLLKEDLDLKDSLRDRLKAAGVSSVEVDRPGNKLRVTIRTSRPGIIIGRKGAEIEKLKQDLAKKTKREVFIDIQEVHKPELDAQLVAESIALQLEKRVAFRRAMRKAVDSALRFGCKGIKVRVSGRLNGAEIARSEWYLQGQLPLHTLRADVDYGFAQAYTTYGVIGVKCWTYKGEIIEGQTRRDSLRNDPEPRRQPLKDRRERRPLSAPPPPPIQQAEPAGGAVQSTPSDLSSKPNPIVPPLAPPQPSWKQEIKHETAVPEAALKSENVAPEPTAAAEPTAAPESATAPEQQAAPEPTAAAPDAPPAKEE